MKYITIGVMAASASFILQVLLAPVGAPFVLDKSEFAGWWIVFGVALLGLWATLGDWS